MNTKTDLDTNSISLSPAHELMLERSDLLERIQAPAAPLPHQPEDRSQVVAEHDGREPPAVDQPRDLEDVLVLRRALLSAELV